MRRPRKRRRVESSPAPLLDDEVALLSFRKAFVAVVPWKKYSRLASYSNSGYETQLGVLRDLGQYAPGSSLKSILQKVRVSGLKRLYEAHSSLGCRVNKNALIDILISRFNGASFLPERREEEKRLLQSTEYRDMKVDFLVLCGISIPRDLVEVILSFTQHQCIVSSFGFASWDCYHLTLSTWASLVLKKKYLYQVSTLILQSAHEVVLTGITMHWKRLDYKYVLENVNSSRLRILRVKFGEELPGFYRAWSQVVKKTGVAFSGLREFWMKPSRSLDDVFEYKAIVAEQLGILAPNLRVLCADPSFWGSLTRVETIYVSYVQVPRVLKRLREEMLLRSLQEIRIRFGFQSPEEWTVPDLPDHITNLRTIRTSNRFPGRDDYRKILFQNPIGSYVGLTTVSLQVVPESISDLLQLPNVVDLSVSFVAVLGQNYDELRLKLLARLVSLKHLRIVCKCEEENVDSDRNGSLDLMRLVSGALDAFLCEKIEWNPIASKLVVSDFLLDILGSPDFEVARLRHTAWSRKDAVPEDGVVLSELSRNLPDSCGLPRAIIVEFVQPKFGLVENSLREIEEFAYDFYSGKEVLVPILQCRSLWKLNEI